MNYMEDYSRSNRDRTSDELPEQIVALLYVGAKLW
jgi:hypothetical protein